MPAVANRYLPTTPAQRAEMLRVIGVGDLETLLERIPSKARLGRDLGVPAALAEGELTATETESRETLDEFCDAMLQIARKAETDPHAVHAAPVTTPVGRLDQTLAARQPDLRLTPKETRRS
jgi:hypothetical protein